MTSVVAREDELRELQQDYFTVGRFEALVQDPKRNATAPLHVLSNRGEPTPYTRPLLQGLRPVSERPNAAVLEVGCGTGAVLLSVQQLLKEPPYSVELSALHGVDPCAGAIKVAQERLGGALGPMTWFAVADGKNMRGVVEDNKYDITISIDVAHLMRGEEELAAFAKEMVRVTKPGGAIGIATIPSPSGGSGMRMNSLGLDWWQASAPQWGAKLTNAESMHIWPGIEPLYRTFYTVYLSKEE